MNHIKRGSRAFAAWAAVVAAFLFGVPAFSAAQETNVGMITVVTDLYQLEGLLPEMSPVERESLKDVASWCLDMADHYKARLGDAKNQVDFQREAKRAEIKALEARAKSAGQAKDEGLKKQLTQEVRAQKVELEILDAVKELAGQEAAASGDFEAAGKSLKSVVEASQDLSDNRQRALRGYEKTAEEAAQAGLAAPLPPGPDYPTDDRVAKTLSEAGKNIKNLGDRLTKLAKARQDLLKAWEKLEKTKAGK